MLRSHFFGSVVYTPEHEKSQHLNIFQEIGKLLQEFK